MAELGYFFTSAAGDRKYTAADFADLFNQLAQRQSGVIRGLDNTLQVTNNGTLSVDVNTGVAQKAGYLYQNTASLNTVLDAVTSGSKRIDRIVVRVDLTARQAAVTIIKGTESGMPTAPAITGSTDVLLGKILLDRSSGSYTYTVTDERTYSDALLAPATVKKFNEGTYTIDDIAEGTTYKRILAAVATALNAGTYDAATCTAFGIGTQTAPVMASSVDNYRTGGIFKDPGSLTNSPFGAHQAKILVISQDATHCSQLAFRYGSGAGAVYIKIRNWNGASWGEGWKDVWTSDSDGNGGQPPQKKGTIYSVTAQHATATTIATLPNIDATYLITGYLPGVNADLYSPFAIVQTSSNGYATVSYYLDKTNMFITMSGMNVQLRQTSGLAQTVYARIFMVQGV